MGRKAIITRRKSFLRCAIRPVSLEALLTECCSSMSSVTFAASRRTPSGRSASFASCKPREGPSLGHVTIRIGNLGTIVPDVSHHPIHDSVRTFNESVLRTTAEIPMIEYQAKCSPGRACVLEGVRVGCHWWGGLRVLELRDACLGEN